MQTPVVMEYVLCIVVGPKETAQKPRGKRRPEKSVGQPSPLLELSS